MKIYSNAGPLEVIWDMPARPLLIPASVLTDNGVCCIHTAFKILLFLFESPEGFTCWVNPCLSTLGSGFVLQQSGGTCSSANTQKTNNIGKWHFTPVISTIMFKLLDPLLCHIILCPFIKSLFLLGNVQFTSMQQLGSGVCLTS